MGALAGLLEMLAQARLWLVEVKTDTLMGLAALAVLVAFLLFRRRVGTWLQRWI